MEYWRTGVQTVLDTVPATAVLLAPVPGADGAPVDYVIEAVGSETTDAVGRRGTELLGLRVSDAYPTLRDNPLWAVYQEVLATGQPRRVGPVSYVSDVDGVRVEGEYTFRVSRLGPDLVVAWTPYDERQHQADRVARAERLVVDLQKIILPMPEEPVDLPGLRVAVRYLPAEQAARIGGDWYHTAALPGGRTLLAIGDVAGHGLPAAATMARLRLALAALVAVTTDPAELLGLLNRVLFDTDDGATATAVVARYDPATQVLTWAQAGHPAPLLARAGVPVPLDRPPGLLLGAVRDAPYATATVRLDQGDLFLLYTDGLVERPGRTLAEGLEQVVAAVTDAIRCAPDQPLARLLAGLRQANPADDTCLVAARPLRPDEAGPAG
ncbi:PP2C family protein-serine/threonine phosphatase [Planosporangium sp. 12N6]|uniref:PP2C family protein-serine/threonine phosphatase n=1 Tax=Planosporangium spinosum TaxID=3402278 RepID=UPI003CFB50CA